MDYERLYRYRFRRVDQATRSAVWGPIARFVYAQMDAPQRVLDPAAGRGEFINSIPAPERWAVDMSAYEEAARAPGTTQIVADIMSTEELPSSHFDGIFVSNFLEHLGSQQEVNDFLVKMLDTARPGCRIAIMGPNIRYCGKRYWDFADHQVELAHGAVEEHLFTAGFEPTRTFPRFIPYSFSGRLPASVLLTRAYLAFRPAWWLLGKQFLVIGRRP